MAGLSFLQAGFLVAGAAAAALPVIIHLLLRQRARPIPIGSVRFLQTVIRQHTRRRRIKQWLLLALRVLALLLLGALFARPFFDRSAEVGRNRELIVLIDRSASMEAPAQSGGTMLQTAIAAARRELDSAEPNTKVRVAFFDVRAQEQPLENWEKSAAAPVSGTDYSAAIAWARDKVAASTRASQRVVLITDLQESGLRKASSRPIPATAQATVIDVGRAMSRNVAIEDAQATFIEIRPKKPVTVAVRVRNTGVLPAKNVALTLQLEGPGFTAVREKRTVTLSGGEVQTIAIPLQVEKPGLYAGHASIAHEDDLAFDNQRYVAFHARRPDRVLLVDGEQGLSVYGAETYYLDTALRLTSSALEGPPRTLEVERIVWEDGNGFPDLAGFRAVILANVGRLSDTDTRRLRQFVEAGGGLLLFSGDQTSRPAVLSALRESGLVNAAISSRPAVGAWRITSWEKDHGALRPFADPQHGDLRRLSFRVMNTIRQVSPPTRAIARVGDRPLLLENSLGKGRVLFVATAVDRQWSDWPQTRLYVPMLRQMTAWLCGWLEEQGEVQNLIVSKPGEKPGIERTGDGAVVRNVDASESDLRRVSEASFRKRLGLGEDKLALERAKAALPAPPGAERPDESWRAVALLLFVLLVGEMLFSSRVHA